MERFPKLKVLLPHGGGYLAHYWARMDHAWKARADCRTVINRKPSSYLEKFYFDSITFDRGMLKSLVERFGAKRVVLGTDYPYDMGMEHPLDFIGGAPGISKADKERIMGGNAARLLKLDYTKSSRRRTS
jgi:aminocarboxymuconate-semialdehyde decarboxylase